ncbi:hypothetical protein CDV31_000544 [Fusarium ambrosium]|uniref:Uncharacterized protein n=1 Tax=Fusarium ambrosium TaxID=131363 RepID=A0A428V259_9HYPO|nr:hypothetical protein CDV31_000544 [Fusarium ambrosium]
MHVQRISAGRLIGPEFVLISTRTWSRPRLSLISSPSLARFSHPPPRESSTSTPPRPSPDPGKSQINTSQLQLPTRPRRRQLHSSPPPSCHLHHHHGACHVSPARVFPLPFLLMTTPPPR